MIEIDIKKQFRNGDDSFSLDLRLSIEQGSLTAISGVSGAGKTTLLRMIAGLEKPDIGSIMVNKNLWFESNSSKNLKPQERKVGMVFQEAALFPNMTVEENLLFASKKQTDTLDKVIQLTDIQKLINRNPSTLSGGQKQRVALARAIVQDPDLLLLDEPLSALDGGTRHALQLTILKIQKEFSLTTLLVSHDQSEVLRLADHMVVINDGQVSHSGSPQSLIAGTSISGKFQFHGELISLEKQDILYVASVLIGNHMIQVVVDGKEAQDLQIGDRVLVASKAFNPIIKRIDQGSL